MKFAMCAVPDHEKHAQEDQLRRAPHEHDLKHAVVRGGVWCDLHSGAKVGYIRDHHTIAWEFLRCSDRASSQGWTRAINGEGRLFPADQGTQRGNRVYDWPADQPGIICNLTGYRGDANIYAPRCGRLRSVGAGHLYQVHRIGLPCEQQLGGITRVGRYTVRPSQIIAAPGWNNSEHSVTLWLRPSDRTRDRAHHSVSTDRDHMISSCSCLGGQKACVLQASTVTN
jgi:hypothetical protein